MGALRVDHDAVVSFTQDLVRIPSVNRPGQGEAPAAKLVAERMRSFGWEPTVDEVAPGRPNVVAVIAGDGPGPTLLFEGHTDVVTEGDLDTWTRDPFGGEVIDGRLYGRGSADMKGGVAAMLHAAAAVAERGGFPGRIVVAALCDEEGMMLGAKHFVASGRGAGIDAAIVCEPEDLELCTSQKGAIRLRLDVTGRMAHGAMPDHGINPIPVLSGLVIGLGDLERQLHEKAGRHPHLGLPFVTPTVARAGDPDQLNVIPARAWLGVDVRTVPAIDHEELLGSIEQLADVVGAATSTTIAVTVIDDRPPTEVAEDHAIVRAMAAAHQEVTGEPVVIGGVPGTTDGTILTRDADIPVVVYGPGGKWIAHQADEFVEVAQLTMAADVYAEAAWRFLHGGAS